MLRCVGAYRSPLQIISGAIVMDNFCIQASQLMSSDAWKPQIQGKRQKAGKALCFSGLLTFFGEWLFEKSFQCLAYFFVFKKLIPYFFLEFLHPLVFEQRRQVQLEFGLGKGSGNADGST